MKKLVLIAVLLLSFSVMVMAQDTPAVEVFGGYSYIHVSPLPYMNADAMNMNGWDASVTFNGNKWAGFVVDFGGDYGTLMRTNIDSWADVKVHSMMFGPKVTLLRGKVSPFVQALFGVARASYKEVGVVNSENDFAMAFGGGVDVNLNKMIAVRPVQVEYFGFKEGHTGDFIKNFRYSAGIVLKLGKK
jgi:opacity protein-like surface antigen